MIYLGNMETTVNGGFVRKAEKRGENGNPVVLAALEAPQGEEDVSGPEERGAAGLIELAVHESPEAAVDLFPEN